MHKYEGMDYKQIGDVLKLSESATKSLLFRAYQTLREKLKEFMLEGNFVQGFPSICLEAQPALTWKSGLSNHLRTSHRKTRSAATRRVAEGKEDHTR